MPYLGNEVAPLVQALEGKELKLDSDGDSSIQASTDDTVVFKTNGSNRWTLNSSGNLFPASTSQGIVLGATSDTSANRLDDFEEGTFTATAGFLTSNPSSGASTSTGHYVKIGSFVSLTVLFSNINVSGASGQMTITGLPFTALSTDSLLYMGASPRVRSATFQDYVTAFIVANETRIRMEQNRGTQFNDGLEADDLTDGATDVAVSINYRTS